MADANSPMDVSDDIPSPAGMGIRHKEQDAVSPAAALIRRHPNI